MAEVYAARILGEGGFEKVVALKRMLPTLAEDERFVTMFLDEGRVAANISSPNVVQTLDLGRAEDDSLYLVMELVVGVPLSRLLREVLKGGKHVETDIAVEILAQAASGLHDAHEATTPMGDPLHIVHRDVSPQNILVDRAGRTRILDFGVARAMQRSSHTQTGEVKGKMAYFAPEQATGAPLDRRVDIWALGVVAWECLSGRRLFKTENPLHTLQKITQEPIPTLLDVRPTISPKLSICVAKALRRNPDERYATCREFAQALRTAAASKPTAVQIGAYVQANGGDSLRKLETGLKMALAGNDDELDTLGPSISSSTDSQSIERTPLSQSQIVATGTGTPVTVGVPANNQKWFIAAAIIIVAALLGGAFAWGASSGTEEDVPPQVAADPVAPETPDTVMAAVPVHPPAMDTTVMQTAPDPVDPVDTIETMETMRPRWQGRMMRMVRGMGTTTNTTASTMETVTAMTETTMAATTMVEAMQQQAMQEAMMEAPMMEESSSMMVLQGVDAFDMY